MVTLRNILDFFSNRNVVINHGNTDLEKVITGGRNIAESTASEITFLSKKYSATAMECLQQCKAALVIIDQEIYSSLPPTTFNFTTVVMQEPKNGMVDCLTHFFSAKSVYEIHTSAIIHSTVKKGKSIFIGPYVVIEEDVIIGENCIIEAFVHIKKGTAIGDNVLIKSGAVIGGGGFGFAKQDDGTWKHFPHFGNVIIENDVSIGSNTCIDRGALGSTRLKQGCKIDNLVHIAHNVIVGENSMVIADAMIGGSTVIGANTWIAPSASVKNGLTIGNNSTIGLAAVVVKNVPDETTVIGNPAKPMEKK
jgi:UDP-3-O-[3-hydroxymyristoyl] glucosamine N-acyltransferase